VTSSYLETAVAPVPPPAEENLTAPLTNAFDYTRSLGSVLGRFAGGLIAGEIIGSRASDGRVFVPPSEYDPVTHAATTEFVTVAPVGTVKSWSWQPEPKEGQALAEPFGWALIRLDGADTDLLHVIKADSADQLSTGMRVRAEWSAQRTGLVTDIAYFVPGDTAADVPANTAELGEDAGTMVVTPVSMTVKHSATAPESAYLRGLKEGKIIGTRTVENEVYVPGRETSPKTGVPGMEPVEVSDKGIVTTFCIVNVPFLGQQIKPPYVAAYVLLDGADIPFLHLILDVAASEVRMGMRIEAVWRPEAEWDYTLRNISHFRPTGEPDADYETYKDHL